MSPTYGILVSHRSLPGPGLVCPWPYTRAILNPLPAPTMPPHCSSVTLISFTTLPHNEPTWRCHQNPFIGALGIQEPVIPGEPLIKG